MKRILDFSKFVNEGVINESEPMAAEGGILIMTEGGVIKNDVPYIQLDPSDLKFSIKTKKDRSYVVFDDDATEDGKVYVGGQDLSNMAKKTKDEAIAKSPSDCQSKAYEILLTIYSVFKPTQGAAIDTNFMEALVKSILMVSKNNTTKTMIVKNSRFKSFISGIVNTPSEAAAKASMGRLANMDGMEVDKIFKAVKAGIA